MMWEVPEDHDPIVAGRQGIAAVGEEGDRLDVVGVRGVLEDPPASVQLPIAHGLVVTGGQEVLAVRRDRRTPDHALVRERTPLTARLDLPEPSLAVLATGEGIATVVGDEHGLERSR